jgi:aliphatic aldoxime dehydratase
MDSSNVLHQWKPRAAVAKVLETAPAEAFSPPQRVTPLRKAPGFVPAVQRWSHQLPAGETQFRVGFFGAQSPDTETLNRHPLHAWATEHLLNHPAGPTCVDHARSRTLAGLCTHTIAAYWVSEARYAVWAADANAEAWWQAPDSLQGPSGVWREILRIPRDRQESLYWLDFPIGLSASKEVALYPTPYCGYYGAMRDRLFAAATDKLEPAAGARLVAQSGRAGFGQHWSVKVPHNMAVLRGGSSWGFMDAGQHADYEAKLRVPVTNGMDYLAQNALPSGCASMRWQMSTDPDGHEEPDEHAHTYFLSLGHLEDWSENHGSHAAIFSAAIRRYKTYGTANQLRTWHEVYVLPEGDQRFEYLNCHPETGILPWFEATQLR